MSGRVSEGGAGTLEPLFETRSSSLGVTVYQRAEQTHSAYQTHRTEVHNEAKRRIGEKQEGRLPLSTAVGGD